MNEQLFYQAVSKKSKELNINPLLLLSGIEGLFTFRDVQLNLSNFQFLDSLILTIFALRIGDQFHTIAEQNLLSKDNLVRTSANAELAVLSTETIINSQNTYLQSFAQILNGKSPVRKYHEKALEVAALEIKKAQLIFGNESIGTIIIAICKEDTENSLGLNLLFNTQ